jgi:hypothetical protein
VKKKRKKKKRKLGPRRKRMRRPARLQAARSWLASWNGKNFVHGYAKYFGVDLICAIKELGLLGVELDAEYVERVKRTMVARKPKAKARSEPPDPWLGYGEWWDDNFFFIAGHTSGGAPYGIQWGEVEEDGNLIGNYGEAVSAADLEEDHDEDHSEDHEVVCEKDMKDVHREEDEIPF